MPQKTIANPAGVWGMTADPEPVTVEMVNNSGGTLIAGDVVITGVNGVLATTTTTASDKHVCGVVGEHGGGPVGAAVDPTTYAAGAPMPVIVLGPARINIGAQTVADGDNLATTTTAKVAGKAADAANVGALQALVGSFIAVAMEASTAKDASNTIRAWISKM